MTGRLALPGVGLRDRGHADISAVSLKLERLLSRQARVGILVNPAEINLPQHPPRAVWSKWPKLRSARRRDMLRGGYGTAQTLLSDEDEILEGRRLAAFCSMLRSGHADQPEREEHKETIAWSLPTLRLLKNTPVSVPGAETARGGTGSQRWRRKTFWFGGAAIVGGALVAVLLVLA